MKGEFQVEVFQVDNIADTYAFGWLRTSSCARASARTECSTVRNI